MMVVTCKDETAKGFRKRIVMLFDPPPSETPKLANIACSSASEGSLPEKQMSWCNQSKGYTFSVLTLSKKIMSTNNVGDDNNTSYLSFFDNGTISN